jgi:hypothetical protein
MRLSNEHKARTIHALAAHIRWLKRDVAAFQAAPWLRIIALRPDSHCTEASAGEEVVAEYDFNDRELHGAVLEALSRHLEAKRAKLAEFGDIAVLSCPERGRWG